MHKNYSFFNAKIKTIAGVFRLLENFSQVPSAFFQERLRVSMASGSLGGDADLHPRTVSGAFNTVALIKSIPGITEAVAWITDDNLRARVLFVYHMNQVQENHLFKILWSLVIHYLVSPPATTIATLRTCRLFATELPLLELKKALIV